MTSTSLPQTYRKKIAHREKCFKWVNLGDFFAIFFTRRDKHLCHHFALLPEKNLSKGSGFKGKDFLSNGANSPFSLLKVYSIEM